MTGRTACVFGKLRCPAPNVQLTLLPSDHQLTDSTERIWAATEPSLFGADGLRTSAQNRDRKRENFAPLNSRFVRRIAFQIALASASLPTSTTMRPRTSSPR